LARRVIVAPALLFIAPVWRSPGETCGHAKEIGDMDRIVVIDTDRAMAQAMALDCARLGVAVRLAETVGEGVRHLADERVSAVLVDAGCIRLTPAEQARVFQEVAPGVAMVVLAPGGLRGDEALKFEVEGFRVVAKPFDAREVIAKIEPQTVAGRRPSGTRAARAR
jgi:DNA-binding response OmpR family regulator